LAILSFGTGGLQPPLHAKPVYSVWTITDLRSWEAATWVSGIHFLASIPG